ncbi:hypothetical protein FACS1894200_02450 [Spirochaetia bacterium]|nr:hypothetical protein FACS1894200_02450 [Spirochaetia bacterium]
MLTLDTGNHFKDKHLGKRAAIILALIVNISRVVLQKAASWTLQMSFYRFFSNPKVSEEALTSCIEGHCIEQSKDTDEILIISDTTELNLTKHIHRITNLMLIHIVCDDETALPVKRGGYGAWGTDSSVLEYPANKPFGLVFTRCCKTAPLSARLTHERFEWTCV